VKEGAIGKAERLYEASQDRRTGLRRTDGCRAEEPDTAIEALKSRDADYAVKKAKHLRRQTEALLRESEEKYHALLEHAGDAIFIADHEGNLIEVNGRAEELTGYCREELSGMHFSRLLPPEELGRAVKAFQEVVEKGAVSLDEVVVLRKDGSRAIVDITGRAITYGRKRVIQGIFRDTTERTRMEEEIRRTRTLLENTFLSLTDAVFVIDPPGRSIISCNPAVERVFGYKCEELIGESTEVLHIDRAHFERFGKAVQAALENRDVFQSEYRMRRKDGKIITTEHSVTQIRDSKGIWRNGVSVVRDISKRRETEEELKQSREQLRTLTAYLQAVREEERTRIAREIHDELGQALTGIRIDLSLLGQKLRRDQKPLIEKVESGIRLIDSTIELVRKISTELRPGVLDDFGLVAAIEWQCQDFQTRTGIACELIAPEEEPSLDRERSTALFRILQETLTNVARHSGAARVRIELKEDGGDLVLTVEDNGRGIREDEIRNPKSLGLLGMRERVSLFGGEILIAGTPGKETKVSVKIPVSNSESGIRNAE
jgi:PAS domain S-box-containing protein